MIQELLGGTNSGFSIGGERKNMFSINIGSTGGILEATTVPHHSSLLSPSPSLSPSSSASAAPASSAAATPNSSGNTPAAENLRCPRCDSANTKFCYYNNYNLTQPRHFCKTCRRYWTKGGALRNVPIGGGCRKNKSPAVVSSSSVSSSAAAAAVKSLAGKMKMAEPARPGFGPGSAGFDTHEIHLPPSPVLWGSPQNSHLFALLRSAQQHHHQNTNPSNPNNPNPSNPNSSLSVKEEGAAGVGSHMVNCSTSGAESVTPPSNAAVNLGRSLGLDPVGQAPSLGLCSSFWRSSSPSNTNQSQYQQTGFTLVDHQSNGNAGIQELYQRLRSSPSSSSGNYYNDPTAVVLTNHHVGSSSSSSVLESTTVNGGAGDQLGFWNNNSAFSWSDLPTTTTNGAYH